MTYVRGAGGILVHYSSVKMMRIQRDSGTGLQESEQENNNSAAATEMNLNTGTMPKVVSLVTARIPK